MSKKSPAKRILKLEGQVIGMGFLLLKLERAYGSDFGEGMRNQVQEAVRDYRQLSASIAQREVEANAKEQE